MKFYIFFMCTWNDFVPVYVRLNYQFIHISTPQQIQMYTKNIFCMHKESRERKSSLRVKREESKVKYLRELKELSSIQWMNFKIFPSFRSLQNYFDYKPRESVGNFLCFIESKIVTCLFSLQYESLEFGGNCL